MKPGLEQMLTLHSPLLVNMELTQGLAQSPRELKPGAKMSDSQPPAAAVPPDGPCGHHPGRGEEKWSQGPGDSSLGAGHRAWLTSSRRREEEVR